MNNPPLVILGLDGGDPGFIQRWAEEGFLPTIASLMKRGCWGRTAGPELISEHGVWVSIFSGISRGRHGYYYFRQLKPGTYDLQTVTGRDVAAHPFWACLQDRNKKVAIIDVPDSYPFAGLSGLQLANWATHHNWAPRHPVYGTSAVPPDILTDARRLFGPQVVIDEDFRSSVTGDRRLYGRLLERTGKKGALCRYLLTRDHFDVVVVVFSESHIAGHQFWKYRPESLLSGTAQKGAGLTHAMRDVYQAIDRQMGLLLEQLPRDANVCVVSSVGMEDHYPTTGLIEAFCRQLGYHAPPAAGSLSRRPLAVFRRTVPEAWRVALSRHLPRETRERLLADQFRSGTEWRKTTAFAIPAVYTSFVRVNLRGREPEGIVELGVEYESLLGRLEADLRQLIDPRTDEPAVAQVARASDLFHCGPPVSLPDLFVAWKPASHFMHRLVHPRVELVQKRPEFFRGSDHSQNGFLACAGPSIREYGAIGDVSLLDLAPTFLSLVDEPIPDRMIGRPIGAIIRG